MAKPYGCVNVGVTYSVADSEPYTQPIAPEGAPDVLSIVLERRRLLCDGAVRRVIGTRKINRIAEQGLTYTKFHTPARSSPTSCLMTIERAAVDVSRTPFVDLGAEAKMAFARD